MTLVLVHGLSGSSRWWRPVVPQLEQHAEVLAVDVPRHRRAFRVEEWLAETIAAPAPVVLVGHSLGGLACVRLAAERPELVCGLVLVAPVGIPSRGFVEHATGLLRTLGTSNRRFLALLVADAVRAGPATLAHGSVAAVRHSLADEFAAVDAPTLLVWGARDPLVPVEAAQEWQRRLPHARLAVLPRAAHVPMLETPSAFGDVVGAFLDDVGHEPRVRPVDGVRARQPEEPAAREE